METANKKFEVHLCARNEKDEIVREAKIMLVPAEEPGKHSPIVSVRNTETGFTFETKLKPVDCSSFEKVMGSLEERMKSPNILEQAEKLFSRLAGIMNLLKLYL